MADIGGVILDNIKSDEVKRTRSGRVTLPRLAFWAGERIFSTLNDGESPVYIAAKQVEKTCTPYLQPTGLQYKKHRNSEPLIKPKQDDKKTFPRRRSAPEKKSEVTREPVFQICKSGGRRSNRINHSTESVSLDVADKGWEPKTKPVRRLRKAGSESSSESDAPNYKLRKPQSLKKQKVIRSESEEDADSVTQTKTIQNVEHVPNTAILTSALSENISKTRRNGILRECIQSISPNSKQNNLKLNDDKSVKVNAKTTESSLKSDDQIHSPSESRYPKRKRKENTVVENVSSSSILDSKSSLKEISPSKALRCNDKNKEKKERTKSSDRSKEREELTKSGDKNKEKEELTKSGDKNKENKKHIKSNDKKKKKLKPKSNSLLTPITESSNSDFVEEENAFSKSLEKDIAMLDLLSNKDHMSKTKRGKQVPTSKPKETNCHNHNSPRTQNGKCSAEVCSEKENTSLECLKEDVTFLELFSNEEHSSETRSGKQQVPVSKPKETNIGIHTSPDTYDTEHSADSNTKKSVGRKKFTKMKSKTDTTDVSCDDKSQSQKSLVELGKSVCWEKNGLSVKADSQIMFARKRGRPRVAVTPCCIAELFHKNDSELGVSHVFAFRRKTEPPTVHSQNAVSLKDMDNKTRRNTVFSYPRPVASPLKRVSKKFSKSCSNIKKASLTRCKVTETSRQKKANKPLRKKLSPTIKTGIGKNLPARGTLKRKRWIVEKLDELNKNHNDDLFEGTEVAKVVPKDPNVTSDCSELSLNFTTPRLPSYPKAVAVCASPEEKDMSICPEFNTNRKIADLYLYRREKRNKAKLASDNEAKEETKEKENEIVPATIGQDEMRKAVQNVNDMLSRIAAKEPEEISSDELDDYYFSDDD